MKNKDEHIYYFQVLLATLIWGSAYPFTKHLVNLVSPLFIVFVRSLIGSLLLIIFVRPSFKKFLNFNMILKLLLMSLLGVSLQQYSQAYALKYTASTSGGFIIALTPIIVVLIEVISGEKISLYKLSGFLSGITGCLIVMYSGGRLDLNLPSTRGDLIFFTSSIMWAFYVVLTKRWFGNYSQKEITTITMIISFLTLLPFTSSISVMEEFKRLDHIGWVSIFYLCFFSSFIGYLFWNNSVEKLGPVKTSYFIYDEPFATIISAYFVIGEKINILTFYGGILILLGVYFVLYRDKAKEVDYV